MMYTLILIAAAAGAFYAGRFYESVMAEVRRKEAKARWKARRTSATRKAAKDTLFLATVKAEYPGE